MRPRVIRAEKLGLQLITAVKDALRRAGKFGHKPISDFVLESALSKADEVLADGRIIKLGPED